MSHNKVSDKLRRRQACAYVRCLFGIGVMSFATLVRAGFRVLGVECCYRLVVGALRFGPLAPPLSDSCALLTAWSSGPSCESLGATPLAELILRSTSRTGLVFRQFEKRVARHAGRTTACLVHVWWLVPPPVCTKAAPEKFDAVKFVLDCASGVMVGSDWWKLARSASS